MKTTTAVRSLLALSLLASSATAQIWSEDFEGGSNVGDWVVYWDAVNTMEVAGGNPGAYLHMDNTSATGTCHWLEIFPETWPSGFSGDWRAAGVNSVGLDVDVRIGPANQPTAAWSVVIGNDNGTPGDDSDDCKIVHTSTQVPPTSPGWTSFDFPVPTTSTTVPNDWYADGLCNGGNDALWNFVIENVDYVYFRMDTDPVVFCAFGTSWDMGVDNIRVEGSVISTAFCFGDNSGTNCPCGNTGAADEGCANSGGSGATLIAAGTSGVGADDITFDLGNGPGPVPAILFTGTTQANGGAGFTFGDGLRCAGGTVQRLGVQILDGSGSGTWGPGLAAVGGWGSGDTRYFQGWYRDVTGPCNGLFNTSHAVGVVFTP